MEKFFLHCPVVWIPLLQQDFLSRAIGKQLTCVFVDHGLLRKNEGDEVEAVFGPNGQFDLNFIRVNAQQRYYDKLAGVTEPEQKRKIIGEEFIRVFEEEGEEDRCRRFPCTGNHLSGRGRERSWRRIRSDQVPPQCRRSSGFVDFKEIIEPLRNLFKMRYVKQVLSLAFRRTGIPSAVPGTGTWHPYHRRSDRRESPHRTGCRYIYREEIAKAGLQRPSIRIQYFAALTNMRSVGVMGDERTYDYAVALRAVNTVDFMTAEAAEIPYAVLKKVMNRIINEVKGVNRVFYDLTSKPPGTIEFE